MNTSILTVVLAGALLAGQNGTPTWQNSYAAAQGMGTEQQKPVLVVFGSGANGWTKVVRGSEASPEVPQLMKQYVCCYVDMTTPEGMKLAKSFEMTGAGLVISDRSGVYQAYWHQGDMSNQEMVRCLTTYADPSMVLQATAVSVSVPESAPVQTAAQTEKIGESSAKQPAGQSEKPMAHVHWMTNYSKALDMASSEHKPICMVFGSGANGQAKMLGSAPSAECMQLLSSKYLCVYCDTSSQAGRRLAQECSIFGDSGMIISDRNAQTQAFWHEGMLNPQAMMRCLTRYSDPQVVVRSTETAGTARTSFYPESDAGMSSPNAGYSGYGITGASYCPSCNNARRR
jgi:hypothetical protein